METCIWYIESYLIWDVDTIGMLPHLYSKWRAFEYFPLPLLWWGLNTLWLRVIIMHGNHVPIYAFCRHWYPYHVLKISHWLVDNCSHGTTKNVLKIGHLSWPVAWPEITWDRKLSRNVRKGRVNRYANNSNRCFPLFSQKNGGGAPPGRGLKHKHSISNILRVNFNHYLLSVSASRGPVFRKYLLNGFDRSGRNLGTRDFTMLPNFS